MEASRGGTDGEQMGNRWGADGEQTASRGGAEGEVKDSKEEQRESRRGAEGEQRGSRGGAEGEQRGKEGRKQAFVMTLRRGVAWIFFYKCMRFHLNIRISSSCIMLLKKTLYTAVHLSLGYKLGIFIIFFNQYILLKG